jgi:outer membrane biosynthesis protein TonB
VQVPYAPAIAPQRVIVDGETQAKSLVYKVTPEIPAEARTENSSGTVVLHAVIGTGGRPGELQYVSGPQALAQPAIDAVTWWQYRITVVNDEAVEVDTTIDVVFPPPSK